MAQFLGIEVVKRNTRRAPPRPGCRLRVQAASIAAKAAFSTDHGAKIIEVLIADLRERRLVLPSINTLERLALKGRARARREAAMALHDALTGPQRDRLQALLANDAMIGQARLTWLGVVTCIQNRFGLQSSAIINAGCYT